MDKNKGRNFLVLVLCLSLLGAGCGLEKRRLAQKESMAQNGPGLGAQQSQAIAEKAKVLKNYGKIGVAPNGAACQGPDPHRLEQWQQKKTMVIPEKMFITTINAMYVDFKEYKDKVIEVEGMFAFFYNGKGAKEIPAVYRLGPGCCSNDGWGGFPLYYNGPMPPEGVWVRVKGVPEMVKQGKMNNIYLHVISLDILEQAGASYVKQ